MTIAKPVTLRALLQRLNRKLAKEGEVLKTLRGQRYANDLGRYYIVNLDRKAIDTTDVDPVALGRALGVLAAWEMVVPAVRPTGRRRTAAAQQEGDDDE